MNIANYLPQDRRRALAQGQTLPGRAYGTVLFADISGFTPFTEALRHAYGSRRGAEELSKHLDAVYTALIAEVERYGGSVTGFAGDAITCWFDETDGSAPLRAVTCATALQTAMQAFAEISLPEGEVGRLAIKVGLATGEVRRLVVGDEADYWLDVLAGETVNHTAVAEQLATAPDILLDEATVTALGDTITLTEWRTSDETGQRFGVLGDLTAVVELSTPAPLPELDEETTRPWLNPLVYDRAQTGHALLQTDFRPCVALFIRFVGIDYEADTAADQLNQFVRPLQTILAQYEGTLIDLIFGDKGSYAYINFGALSIHEDDARRAVKTAVRLRQVAQTLPFLEPLQIGITSGIMRTGAYGGANRRHYGALGDEVNLAARLMSKATLGEVLVSKRIQTATAPDFAFIAYPAVQLKGKTDPVPVFAVAGQQKQRAIRLQEPAYALPMVGRQVELQQIEEKLALAAAGQSQIIAIVAEAGLGKSRLVAEVIRAARQQGFVGYGGACQSDAINTPYQAWKGIWQAFFGVDHELSLKNQLRFIEGAIEDRAPARMGAMPLLNSVLDLAIPDNDFTKTLEPQYRKSALRALLEDCLRVAAQDEPLLIVIEDLHWIDALSHDLLEELARALTDSRVCFVLAYRPPQLARLEALRLEAMPNFTKIELQELTHAEAEQAIRAKLAQLYPERSERGGALPTGLVEALMTRAQGNPFYLEELLNYLHDRSLDPAQLDKIELPDNLHALILSRIDQLSEDEKNTLRVASIVGRLFRAAWLTGYYPELGASPTVKAALDELSGLDITPLDSPEPELAYLFKHIVTHEVTYESLPFATRAKLHEQLAKYLESLVGATRESPPPMDTIAFHYGRSDNTAKKREYYQEAADAAQAVSAFVTVVEYLTRLLDLTPAGDPAHSALALQLADAHLRLGDFPAVRAAIAQAQAAATNDIDRASALALLGEMTSDTGDYAATQKILTEAVSLARASHNQQALSRALSALGFNDWRLGKLDDAKVALNESLTLARALGNLTRELLALNRLAVVALQQDLTEAERLLREVHTRAVAASSRAMAATALNNLGQVHKERKEYTAAHGNYRQALPLAREIGAQNSIALYLLNLADLDIKLGQFAAARAGLREGLALAVRLGALPWVVAAVTFFANLAHAEGQTKWALALLGLACQHPAWSSDNQRGMEVDLAEWALDPAVVEAGLKAGEALDWDATVRELLRA